MASPLADAHIEGERRLRLLVGQAVERIWEELPGYDRENLDEWLSTVLPVVAAGQRASTSLTEGYLARVLHRQPLGVNADGLIGAGARNGTPPEEVYRRPFVTIWSALSAGTLYDNAVSAGLARATGTAAMDVQLAARSTFGAVGREDGAIRGYQRVADGGACTFCQLVDGAFVKSADAMALHNHCGCGLEPVLDDVAPTPAPEGVAVHQHGELGPVLTDPAHGFTTASQALS